MGMRLVLVGVMVTAILAAGACSLAKGAAVPEQVDVDVTTDDFMNTKHITKEVQVPVGGVLVVTLGSNPATGFSWTETAQIGDGEILLQNDHKFQATGNAGVGAPGEEVWTFKALGKGTTSVTMGYSRPWEGGEKDEWTFKLTVTVK